LLSVAPLFNEDNVEDDMAHSDLVPESHQAMFVLFGKKTNLARNF